MYPFLYVLLSLYLLPLLAMVVATVLSDFFQTAPTTVGLAAALSAGFLTILRAAFATMLIPLITTYSMPTRNVAHALPQRTRKLLWFLTVWLTTSVLMYAVIDVYEPSIRSYGENTYEAFRSTSQLYVKELISYIMITLGLSLRKAASTPRIDSATE